MLKQNYDRAKIFVWGNRYGSAQFTNGTGSLVTLERGAVLGRVTATGKVVLFKSDATDGSQIPLGINGDTREVAAGATVDITFCTEGDVVEDKILFQSPDTLATAVTGSGIIRDLIQRNTKIRLIATDCLTNYDNQ